MIVRVFRVLIRVGHTADFERMVIEQSIPWLNQSEGLIGYYPGKPIDEDAREFVMVTLWRDLASVEKFAGPDWKQPIVTEDEAPLVEEMHAYHYIHFDEAWALYGIWWKKETSSKLSLTK